MNLETFNRRMAQFPWLVVGAPLGTLGTQIDKPGSTACFIAAAVCTIIYGVYHVNERGGAKKDKGKKDGTKG